MTALFPRRSWLTRGIWVTIPSLHVQGMTLFPFVFIKHPDLLKNKAFVRHERIHLAQQLEMAILPFYLAYLGQYGWLRLKGLGHDKAYRGIHFEVEAYANDKQQGYLSRRRLWACWR